ncbi:[FeFe] hydrogenase H-cluster maturation GTPase HydF [Romboutsia sedimentorum]|uniref:[FeFe] hydrogenase H-cluster maturation GTPase HydF n=1 Tax=Romboutsia sedimentorum TaxID=1368474 RepID=UPI0024DEBBE3|nr:[FeFe] hydrogenase H-cluster maturation GTPase HydF [Romboutsia sedimentorum]MDK2586237.1 [FeFe] hydrogenase H-cluster maturation GTPase HydF [Romboutsia sedimentorum]
MSLNSTPQSVRVHIGIFGKRNAGKSSVINAITNQEAAIVSDVLGTTTDPVFRPMEILPIGPCVLIDTAGLDDVGELGKLRINKSMDVLDKTDIALIVIDSSIGICEEDLILTEKLKLKKIPYILVLNKVDKISDKSKLIENVKNKINAPMICVSSKDKIGIEELKKEIINVMPQSSNDLKLVSDLIKPKDFVVLVVPIDKAAPKGRLILPQQQVIRDILDNGSTAIVVKEDELKDTLESLNKKPSIVITDSQVFESVNKDVPKDILLTSFSILFARQKGDLDELIKGAYYLDKLKDGDKILIAEGCTHHRQSDDIGKFKIPNLIRQRSGKDIIFEFTSGTTFTEDITQYALVVHCGACMMNRNAMLSRIEKSKSLNVPIVNYGVLIAYTKGILDRTLEPFKL